MKPDKIKIIQAASKKRLLISISTCSTRMKRAAPARSSLATHPLQSCCRMIDVVRLINHHHGSHCEPRAVFPACPEQRRTGLPLPLFNCGPNAGSLNKTDAGSACVVSGHLYCSTNIQPVEKVVYLLGYNQISRNQMIILLIAYCTKNLLITFLNARIKDELDDSFANQNLRIEK